MRSAATQSDHADKAETLIRETGQRLTDGRKRVLSVLLAAPRALSHTEIEEALEHGQAIDRVTVYRVLDWLTERHLAHKIAGDDRIWRFKSEPRKEPHHHAHFKCLRCLQVFCLEDVHPSIPPTLPPGYLPQEIEVTVKGLCARCRKP